MSSRPPANASTADAVEAALIGPGAAEVPPAIEVLGPYRLLREIGRGGMGAVFLAHDSQLDRHVALKVVLPHRSGDPAARDRLLREARAAAAVTSDHVVPVFNVGEEGGVVYIAMPVLAGVTLETHLTGTECLPLTEVVRIGRQVALGLAAAHARGFIHRDIKPGNLWLEDPDGRVKILDFGLARRQVERQEISSTGSILGTPHYMSPEQARGGPIDARTDLFSLGVVLYRLATGRLPFAGESVFDILTSVANDTPTPVGDLRPDAPPRLIALIDRLMAKGREGRPVDAGEVVTELDAIGQAFALVGFTTTAYSLPRRASASFAPTQTATPIASSPTATQQSTSLPLSAPPVSTRTTRRQMSKLLAAVGLAVLAAGTFWLGAVKYARWDAARKVDRLCSASEAVRGAGRYAEAIALADQAIAAAPAGAPAYAHRGQAKYFLGDEYGALDDCDEALARDPDLAIALAFRAPLAFLRRPAGDGVRDGERALELAPNLPEARTGLAVARLRAGDHPGALAAADLAVEKDPADPEAHRARGLALADSDPDRAAPAFDAAVEHSGGQAYYLAARAEFLVARAATVAEKPAQDLLDRAAADVRRSLEADPRSSAALVAAAQVEAARGRWLDVIESCERAVAANPRCVAAYLRAADDLSPRDSRRYRMLQDSLMEVLDLRELKGGDFSFGALLTDIQRLVSVKAGPGVTIYIDYETFPVEQQVTLRDAKVNLNSLMDATGENLIERITLKMVLEVLTRQVGATYWVTPEHIDIVEVDGAVNLPSPHRHLMPPTLIDFADLADGVRRLKFHEQALEQTVDLRELKGGDFAFGSLLTDLDQLISKRMGSRVTLYINYRTFQPEQRITLRDAKVNLNFLIDVTGENLIPDIKLRRVLDGLARQLGASVRTTPEYVEFFNPDGDLDLRVARRAEERRELQKMAEQEVIEFNAARRAWFGWLGPWQDETFEPDEPEQPRIARAKPRPEAIAWLDRCVRAVPESARPYFARGMVRLEQAEFDAAIADFDQAIRLKPGYPEAVRMRTIADGAKDKRLRERDEVAARARGGQGRYLARTRYAFPSSGSQPGPDASRATNVQSRSGPCRTTSGGEQIQQGPRLSALGSAAVTSPEP